MCIEVCVRAVYARSKKQTDLKDKGFVSLCCQPDFYLRAYAAPTLTSMPYVTINAQSTTIPRAPFVVLFDLKPLVFERVQHCLGAPLQWGPGANCPCCPPPPSSALLWELAIFTAACGHLLSFVKYGYIGAFHTFNG